MEPGEFKYYGNFFIHCDEIHHSSGERHVLWRVGEVVQGVKHYSSQASPQSFEEALDWIVKQQSS